MQDDNAEPGRPATKKAPHLDPKAVPAAHDHINGPGMTNGVPDQMDEAEATGGPGSDRQKSETAAGSGSGS